jgi:hypothetical protein
VDEILGQAGRQFDPAVVEGFLTLDHPTLLSRVEDWKPAHNGQDPRSIARRALHA